MQKRAYEGWFGFEDADATTLIGSLYANVGRSGNFVIVDAGQHLAEDFAVGLTVGRNYRNGWRIAGAWYEAAIKPLATVLPATVTKLCSHEAAYEASTFVAFATVTPRRGTTASSKTRSSTNPRPRLRNPVLRLGPSDGAIGHHVRARVDARTLSGSWKYFETVGREMPLTAENSSMFLIFASGTVAIHR